MWKLFSMTFFIFNASAYKILVVFPIPGRSHAILGDGYVRNLLKAGHEVTYITPFPVKNPARNLHQIDVSENIKHMPTNEIFDFQRIMKSEVNYQNPEMMMTFMHYFANVTFHNGHIQRLIYDTNQTFDAVIVEWLFSELFGGLAAVFDCPLIWSSSMEINSLILSLVDDFPNPAYSSIILAKDYSFNFLDRIENLEKMLYIKYLRWKYARTENEIFAGALGPAIKKRGREVSHYQDVQYNISLILGNSHVATGDPYSVPWNYKGIGGYHIPEKNEPLPTELEQLMNNSKHGVIYFSMGSILKSSRMPEELKQDLLKMFSKLDQTVIWKFEDDLRDLPKNVHIVQWAPQQSILAHPNCVLFISHGGLLSMIETIYFGVPIIGIPMYADQFLNAGRAEVKGYGRRVDLTSEFLTNLKAAITDILRKPSYRQRAKEFSLIFRHRMVSPGDELVHWVEHVVKTRGALHLRSPAVMMHWYKKMYLDLALILLVTFLTVNSMVKYLRNKWKIQYSIKKKLS